jgi:prevent-host-death family protein
VAKEMDKKQSPRAAPPRSQVAAGQTWQLQSAKARFSEVFRLALADGPQFITRGGRDAVVVLPVAQFDALVARSRQSTSLVEFFRESPLAGLDLQVDRDRDRGREIDL